jgi:hypothetical protein
MSTPFEEGISAIAYVTLSAFPPLNHLSPFSSSLEFVGLRRSNPNINLCSCLRIDPDMEVLNPLTERSEFTITCQITWGTMCDILPLSKDD